MKETTVQAPITLNDKVYVIIKDTVFKEISIVETVVTDLSVNHGFMVECDTFYLDGIEHYNFRDYSEIGKKVFLSLPEAEQFKRDNNDYISHNK